MSKNKNFSKKKSKLMKKKSPNKQKDLKKFNKKSKPNRKLILTKKYFNIYFIERR